MGYIRVYIGVIWGLEKKMETIVMGCIGFRT